MRQAGEVEQLNHISHVKQKADRAGLRPRDLSRTWINETDARLKGSARHQFRQGIRRLAALQGLADLKGLLPDRVLQSPGDIPTGWTIVRKAAREAGISGFEGPLSVVKRPADRAGLRLPDLDFDWALATHDALPNRASRSAFRLGLRGLDAMRGLLPDHSAHLPSEPLAVGP